MALVPKISACTLNCCQLLKVRDVTMAYDVTLNPNGWGAPNIAHSVITSASVSVTYPNGTVLTQDVTASVSGATTDPFDLYILSPVGTTFPDGVYTILYTLTDGISNYSTSTTISMDCNVSCCVDKMFAKLPSKMCATCDFDEYLDNALQAEALLRSYRCACNCGDVTIANKILASIQTLCNWSNCNCS